MKIIAFYDDGWFDPTTDFRTWDHLCRAFNIELQMIKESSEILEKSNIYIFDENGKESLNDHIIDLNGVYVFGRTHLDLLKTNINYKSSIRIETPNKISLFGISAASIFIGKLWQ